MKVIACLGNPGRQYLRTRHNIGFILGEYFAREHGIPMKGKSFSSLTGTGTIGETPVVLLMPQTFMNNSGNAVVQALQFYKADPADLVVVHDEIELPFGESRVKFGGGHKGHNGIRSIIQLIGTPDFHRLRIGVGRPDHPAIGVADYVLAPFTGEEWQQLLEFLPGICTELERLVIS